MPEHRHTISLSRRIDLDLSNALKAMASLKKAKRAYDQTLAKWGESRKAGGESLAPSFLKNLADKTDGAARAFARQRKSAQGLGKGYRVLAEAQSAATGAIEEGARAAGRAQAATGALDGQTRAHRETLGKAGAAYVTSSEELHDVALSYRAASAGIGAMNKSAANTSGIENLSKACDTLQKKAKEASGVLKIAKNATKKFVEASGKSLTKFLSDAFTGKISDAKKLFSDLKDHAIKMVRDAASQIASEKFIQPVVDKLKGVATGLLGDLSSGLVKILGLSKGGVVKKPTLSVIGEAGPELVLPLAKIGGEEGLLRLFKSVSEIEAANRIGGTAIPTQAGVEASAALAERIAAARAASTLQIALSTMQFLSGTKNLKTGANLGINVAGALPGLTGAVGLAAFAPAAGAFIATDVLFNKGRTIKKGLSLLGFKGLLSKSTPFRRRIGRLSQAAGLYLTLERFRRTGEAREREDLPLPKAVYRGQMNPEGILLKEVGPAFQLIRRSAEKSGISPVEGVRRYFGEGLYDAYLRALPVFEGDAAGRFVKRTALRLVGEAGPEHIVNVNHPQSIDFFQRGVRPIIRDAIREELAEGGGEAHVYHIHIEGNLSEDRTLEKLARKLEDIQRRRRRYGRA